MVVPHLRQSYDQQRAAIEAQRRVLVDLPASNDRNVMLAHLDFMDGIALALDAKLRVRELTGVVLAERTV